MIPGSQIFSSSSTSDTGISFSHSYLDVPETFPIPLIVINPDRSFIRTLTVRSGTEDKYPCVTRYTFEAAALKAFEVTRNFLSISCGIIFFNSPTVYQSFQSLFLLPPGN